MLSGLLDSTPYLRGSRDNQLQLLQLIVGRERIALRDVAAAHGTREITAAAHRLGSEGLTGGAERRGVESLPILASIFRSIQRSVPKVAAHVGCPTTAEP